MNQTVFPIRPLIQKEESLSSYIMRLAIANQTTYKEICSIISKGKILNRFSFYIDYKLKHNVNVELLADLVNVEKKILHSATLSNIEYKFLESTDMDFKDFMLDLIEKRTRRYCPCCLERSIAYNLLWQVKEINICDLHRVPLVNLCRCCKKTLPYVHENLGKGKCPYCDAKLASYAYQFYYEHIDFKKQLTIYANWRLLLLPYNDMFIKERELALKLLYIANDQNIFLDRQKISDLNSDYVNRLLIYIKEGEDSSKKLYRVTLRLLFQVLESKKMTLQEFFDTTVPKGYINSILNEKKVGLCLSPWCISYLKSDGLRQLKFAHNKRRFQKEHSRNLHICLECGLLFGFDNKGQWDESGHMISMAYSKVRPLLNAGCSSLKIRALLNLTQFQVTKMFAFLLRHKLLTKWVCDRVKFKFSPEDMSAKFEQLETLSGTKITKVRKICGWGYMEYFYYFFDPRVQKVLYINRIVSKNMTENNSNLIDDKRRKAPVRSTNRSLSELEKDALWQKAKSYVINHKHMELTDFGLYEYMGRGQKWFTSFMPEILSWFSYQKVIVIEQLLLQTILERQHIILCKLIELFNLSLPVSLTKIFEHSELQKKYMRVHGCIPFIKKIRDYLVNGEITSDWLEGAIAKVGAGNILMNLIDQQVSKGNMPVKN